MPKKIELYLKKLLANIHKVVKQYFLISNYLKSDMEKTFLGQIHLAVSPDNRLWISNNEGELLVWEGVMGWK